MLGAPRWGVGGEMIATCRRPHNWPGPSGNAVLLALFATLCSMPSKHETPGMPTKRILAERRLAHTFEGRLAVLVLLGGAPGVVLSVVAMWQAGYSQPLFWTLAALVAVSWLGAAFLVRERLTQSLRTISNILMAFREEDYSLRAAKAHRDDPMGEILVELNLFAEVLRTGRLQSVEAALLLDGVIGAVDVAVYAFDEARALRLCNPAGARLLGSRQPLGESAEALGLASCLDAEGGGAVALTLAEGPARYIIRKGQFRSDGRPHTFLVLSNVSSALRREEREAWRKLVRVLGHEINNSLSPIKSIAGTLNTLLQREPLPGDWREDAASGFEIIESRAEALRRFTTGYATLARLPEPRRARLDFAVLARRVAALETRVPVVVVEGAKVEVEVDADQLEQLLINLVRNAADAVLADGGEVRLAWRVAGGSLVAEVRDTGPGILNPDNLFVPFFTTKPGGSGIGLALCRQIAEAHDATLTLENNLDGPGCTATLWLPL